MPLFDDKGKKSVRIDGCMIVWDGWTQPEPLDGGGMKRSFKVVVPPNNPDLANIQLIANEELQASEFKGVLPAGGLMPLGVVGQGEFNNMFPGYAVFRARTYQVPPVYDEAGVPLDAMQCGPSIYNGQIINLQVTAKSYNNKSKGIALQIEAFCPVVSAGAPPQQFGSGGVSTAAAFGGGQPAAQPAAAAVPPQQFAQPAAAVPQPAAAAVPPQQFAQPAAAVPQPAAAAVPPQQFAQPAAAVPQPAAAVPQPAQATSFMPGQPQ